MKRTRRVLLAAAAVAAAGTLALGAAGFTGGHAKGAGPMMMTSNSWSAGSVAVATR